MTTKRKSTSSAPTTNNSSSASGTLSSNKRVKVSPNHFSLLHEEGGEREREKPMTEKEKRKAARMVRNRLSAQNSRDKKRLHLESLESTIHHLQAENKDLVARLVRATGDTNLGGLGGGGVGPGRLPLSPGPSSLKEQEGDGESEGEEEDAEMDDEEDEDEDEEEDEEEETTSTPSPSTSHQARRPSTQALTPSPSASQSQQAQPHNYSSTQASTSPSAFNQTLVNLTTENLTLKERIKKLESVIQVLLAGTSGLGVGFNVVPSVAPVPVPVSTTNGVPVEQLAVNPMSLRSPSHHPSQVYHQSFASTSTCTSAPVINPVSASVPTPAPAPVPTPTFTPNNKDRACQPAALAITSSSAPPTGVEKEVTLQRARFCPLSAPSKAKTRGRVNKDKDMDGDEGKEQRWRMEVGLERVLGWRRGVE